MIPDLTPSQVELLKRHRLWPNEDGPLVQGNFSLETMAHASVNMLVMGLTDSCNLKCAYCFEHQTGKAAQHHMTPEVAGSAVDLLFELAGNTRNLAIRFFGGEPLLRPEIIEHTAAYASGLGRKHNKEITFLLSTNGTLLSDKTIDILSDYGIQTCISLDGTQEVHDAHRRFRNGRGSYQRTLEGVKKILRRGSFPVTAQAVITRQSLGKMGANVRVFRDMGFEGVLMGFVDCKGKSTFAVPGDIYDRLSSDYISFVTECMLEASPCQFDLSGHQTHLYRIHSRQREYYGCPTHAGINMLFVDPWGTVYPCYRLRNRKLRMGNVLNRIPSEQINSIRLIFAKDNVHRNECRRCWAKYICGGKCRAHYIYRAAGDDPADCPLRKKAALNVALYEHLRRDHPELLAPPSEDRIPVQN